MPDRSDPKPGNSPNQLSGGRELVRAPGKLDSGPSTSGQFQKLPTNFGRFRIFRLLGHGAMGSVYLAFDPEMGKEVALKIPKADLAREPILWERFQREARAAGDLNHPYICGMYEVGQIGATHFFSMEYVPGRPLKDYISDRQSQRKVAGVVRKLALGLAHAHAMGIVHRDLKPANVVIDMQGEPKLMDFGLVRRLDVEGDARATMAGVIIGSPGYMAPEQALAEHDRVGPKTDIYGLGVVLFEMLTGSLPFRGSIMSVLTQIATQPPPRPSSLRPDVDPQLEAICLRMLAKNLDDRPPSMAAVAQMLAAWLKGGGAARDSSASEAVATVVAAPPTTIPVEKPGNVPREEKPNPLEIQKRRLTELLDQRQYTPAIALLEDLAAQADKKPDEVTAWAAEELVRVRDEALANDSVTKAIHRAEQKFREFDFASTVKLIQGIPAEERSPKIEAMLQKSITLRDECDRLHRDIEQAIYSSDAKALPELVDELLKRQPTRASVVQLAIDLKQWGAKRVIAIRRCEDYAGNLRRSLLHWKPLTVLTLLAVGFFLLTRGTGQASRVSAESKATDVVEAAEKKPDGAPTEPEQKNEPEPEPRVELVEELIQDGSKRGLWVAPDALHIYWEHDNANSSEIFIAERSSPKEPFGKPERLLKGRHPTLSADERMLVFTINDKLHVMTRQGKDRPFDSPHLIEELQNSNHVRSPSLSGDGLHLVWFNAPQGKDKKHFWFSGRISLTSTWSKPQELKFKDVSHVTSLSWPRLLDNNGTLLCSDESADGRFRFATFHRDNDRDAFHPAGYLEPEEIEGVFGLAPQYVAATDELYFLSPQSRELTEESGGKLVLKDRTEIFRLTAVSHKLGRDVCETITDQNE